MIALLLAATLQTASAAPFGVGQRDYVFQDPSRSRKLAAHVWYPVAQETKQAPIPGHGPFLPVVAALNAPLPAGSEKFPVVLLSHGSGGKADKLFWITEYLVRNGIIVLGVDHPGNMTGDNSADGMNRLWERPKDLTFSLDRLVEVPEFKDRLDLTRVAAAGHSAGAATVLLLAGGRFSASQLSSLVPKCEGTQDPYFAKQCEEMKSIDFKAYPKNLVEADYTDRRVKAVAAFDPGAARWFQDASLKKLSAKPLVFIADKLAHPQDEIFSKEFARKLPPGMTEVVPHTVHFTFLQGCKPGFPPDDPELSELCFENDRKLKIQGEIAAKSLALFRSAWGGR